MNENEIDRTMLRAEPDAGLAALVHEAGQELLEQILSENSLSEKDSEATEIPAGRVVPLRGRHQPSRWLLGVAAAVAVALAVTLPMTLFRSGDAAVIPSSEQPAVVSMNPYLLLEAAAWPMTGLQEVDGLGSETFRKSAQAQLTVLWQRQESQDQVYASRMADSGHHRIELLGVEADLFDRGSGRFEVLLQNPEGKNLWIRGTGMESQEQFETLVRELTPVGEEAWLAGLPADFVKPGESSALGRQILASVPLPNDLIDTRTFQLDQAQDYPSFAVEVVRPVVCTWFRRYTEAFEAGNQERMAEVADVLVGSQDWPVLQQAAETQDWPRKVWAYAHRAKAGREIYKVPSELCQ